jgi:4-amino-4-deoxy-L-arabinose transferase-like glycosyltransferase
VRPSERQPASARLAGRIGLEHAGLGGILALSGLLEFVKLSQNGYANIYYSAAVKSMLHSWHDFFFVSADPNSLITVDKPPLALWLQAVSAKLFGFSPLSLLIPEAICGVLAVALLYWIVAPRFGKVAALISALALAVFPSFVAVSRDNGVDPLLILLMLAACGAGLAAIDSGRVRPLLWSALFVGLAFETKSLAALLCMPGIGLAYLVCAPGSLRRRIVALGAALLVFAVVAASWPLAVDLTPASQRPFVGSTSNNTEVQQIFGYNGFGRIGGQQGGPGRETVSAIRGSQELPLVRPGLSSEPLVPVPRALAHELKTHHPAPSPKRAPAKPGRHRLPRPLPFGGAQSPLRIFGKALGDQAGWLVPLALFGLIALALSLRGWADRRTAGLLVLGGWFLVELLALDFSAGIVHPYYASALGPGLAVMVGAGAVALSSRVRSQNQRTALSGYALTVLAVACTFAVEWILIRREGDPLWWRVPLALLCVGALVAIPLLRRRAGWAVGVAVAALLVAPLAYSFSVWLAPVSGTFPAAGPYSYAGHGGVGLTPTQLRINEALITYLHRHGATWPYPLLTESSDQADSLILLGLRATAAGGYNTTDPAMSGGELATLVAHHKARYVLIAGPYASRGGNGATVAARLVCPEIPGVIWAAGTPGGGSFLLDCAGKAHGLRHPVATARAFMRRYHVKYKLFPL